MEPSGTLREALGALPWWPDAVANLHARWEEQGADATDKAAAYSKRYAGDRAAMVVDVVVSRQRSYKTRVTALVNHFRGSGVSALADLAGLTEPAIGGLRVGEWDTVVGVARGLVAWGHRQPVPPSSDDGLVAAWAQWAQPFDLAPSLGSFVGSVKGIGPALYAYLRMRSGGDGIKPDLRVRARLNELGFAVPHGDAGLLVVAWAAADELGVNRLELDQLLW